MIFRMWVCGLGLAITTAGAAKESVSLRVSPRASFAPAHLVVHTRIEPDVQNRAMEIVADGENYYGSSTIPLDGHHAPKTTTFRFRSLPPGDYEVTAALIGADGQRRALARAEVLVMGSFASE